MSAKSSSRELLCCESSFPAVLMAALATRNVHPSGGGVEGLKRLFKILDDFADRLGLLSAHYFCKSPEKLK